MCLPAQDSVLKWAFCFLSFYNNHEAVSDTQMAWEKAQPSHAPCADVLPSLCKSPEVHTSYFMDLLKVPLRTVLRVIALTLTDAVLIYRSYWNFPSCLNNIFISLFGPVPVAFPPEQPAQVVFVSASRSCAD